MNLCTALIFDAWKDTPWRVGSTVAILAPKKLVWRANLAHFKLRTLRSEHDQLVVDAYRGLVLLEPLKMISGSVVAGASFCSRRAALDEMCSTVRVAARRRCLCFNNVASGGTATIVAIANWRQGLEIVGG